MEQGAILQQLAARFGLRRLLVTPATAIAGARGAQPAKVLAAAGVGGFLRRNACAALRLKLTPNAIGSLNDGVSSGRGLRTKKSKYCA
jgi:hypothetical protein